MPKIDRRIFITENNSEHFQIMSISQHIDGSIYFNWPNFDKTTWHFLKDSEDGILPLEAKLPKEGKFTIHGSGMTGFREHNGQYIPTVVFHGNELKNTSNNTTGIRHLLTAQIPQPNFIPSQSKYLNRKTDYLISASAIIPSVLVFFAFPKQDFSLSMQIKFDKEYMAYSEEGLMISFLGNIFIELDTHVILCTSYFTKNMFWPSNMHIFYDNGYKVPIVLGIGDRKCKAEFREPEYSKSDKGEIIIKL
ncbi:hypothetical protein [Flavobacterium sp. XGLA_31]|uniref:hypothetical protein n=1 Tax=Flavobacterium sp. XGLA_31 TaxID=3447666 RepID=UPI003F2F5D60